MKPRFQSVAGRSHQTARCAATPIVFVADPQVGTSKVGKLLIASSRDQSKFARKRKCQATSRMMQSRQLIKSRDLRYNAHNRVLVWPPVTCHIYNIYRRRPYLTQLQSVWLLAKLGQEVGEILKEHNTKSSKSDLDLTKRY